MAEPRGRGRIDVHAHAIACENAERIFPRLATLAKG